MSLVIKNLKPTETSYFDADWSVDDPSEIKFDLTLLAENMGYHVIGIYNEIGNLPKGECTSGTMFLEPIENYLKNYH